MKVDRLCYEQLYPTGVYANVRLRAEATILAHENIQDCYQQLKDEVEKAFVAMNPQINWSEQKGNFCIDNPNGNSETILPKDERIQSFIATINMCTSLKFLKNFEQRVLQENNDDLTVAYSNKELELLNQQK